MRSSRGTLGLQYSLEKSGHRLGDEGAGGGGGGGGGACGSGGDGGPTQANLKTWMASGPPHFSDEFDGQDAVHPVLGLCEVIVSPLTKCAGARTLNVQRANETLVHIAYTQANRNHGMRHILAEK